MARPDGETLELRLPVRSPEEREALHAALLAARAAELSQVRRRSGRLSWGYGSDSARESMADEVDRAELRWTMLDRLITALEAEASDAGPGSA